MIHFPLYRLPSVWTSASERYLGKQESAKRLRHTLTVVRAFQCHQAGEPLNLVLRSPHRFLQVPTSIFLVHFSPVLINAKYLSIFAAALDTFVAVLV